MSSDPKSLTDLLHRWRDGDTSAGDRLLAAVYPELRRLASAYMRHERRDHTLQATALVHELYLRLFASEPVSWQNKVHFFAVAARQLRRILVNYARDRAALKRGGKDVKLSLTDIDALGQPEELDLMAVDLALDRLSALDSRAARVVELRFFGGLTETEAAEAIGVSLATVKRDWDFARAWLIQQLRTE